MNDNMPEFAATGYTFSLSENEAGTVALGTLLATDADGNAVGYSLVGDTGLFAVGVEDGVLSYIGSGEDYEGTPSYTLEVVAVDSASSAYLRRQRLWLR